MSTSLPSPNEKPISRSRALYLGTSLFAVKTNKFDESKLTLDQLQKTIGERYPIGGSHFAKGIETWLSIFTNGIQMEHSSSSDSPLISALFYYPIKSLVYCGALCFIIEKGHEGKFVPLDTDIARTKENSANPSLFVVLLKGIDSVTKSEIIETNVFVVGTKDISLNLVESCEHAYMKSKMSRNDFYKKYGNIPVVFCLKDDLLKKKDKRVVVKHFDLNGYFYATENTDIDLWQLFEGDDDKEIAEEPANKNGEEVYSEITKEDQGKSLSQYVDPYEKTENLIGVDKRIDPETGQNIYVRYLREQSEPKSDLEALGFGVGSSKMDPIVIREKTPSPIVYERYIKKKAPQVIIKEIHVQDQSPPPIKYVQKTVESYHNQILIDKNATTAEITSKKMNEMKSTIQQSASNAEANVRNGSEQSQTGRMKKSNTSLRKDQSIKNMSSGQNGRPYSPPPKSRASPQNYGSQQQQQEAYVRKSSAEKSQREGARETHQSEPIYSRVNQFGQKPNKNVNSNVSQRDGQIEYRDYNPYAGYTNYNGVPTQIRRNPQPYHSSRNNPYSNAHIYSGNATFYNHHNAYNNYTSHNKTYKSSHYHSHRSVDERRNHSNNNGYPDYPDKYEKHHSYNLKEQGNHPHEINSRQYGSNSEKTMDRKKKIYVVNESELELLKAKLRSSHKNNKIVIVDESEIDTLKGRLFGNNISRGKSAHYHSRRYE